MKKIAVLFSILCLPAALFAFTQTELESAALKNSPSIRTAREDMNQALLDLKDAKAGRGPTLDLTITGSYIANPLDPININPADYIDVSAYGISNTQIINLYKGMENTYYSFGLQLTQPVFTWGKLSKAVDIYSLVYNIRTIQYDDASDKVMTELSTRLKALDSLVQIRDLLYLQKETAARLVALAGSAVENGVMLPVDALEASVQARQIDVSLATVLQQIRLMETAVSTTTGIPDFSANALEGRESRALDTNSAVEVLDGLEREKILAMALDPEGNQLRILADLSTVSELSRSVAQASVNWKPDLALVINASYGGSRLPVFETDWYRQDDWNAIVTVALSTSIWDGGKAVRDVSRKTSELEQASIDIDDAVSQITGAVEQSLTEIELYRAQNAYLQARLDQLEEKIGIQERLMESGYGSESDYLKTLLEIRTCRIEMLQQQISLDSAVETLRYLTQF